LEEHQQQESFRKRCYQRLQEWKNYLSEDNNIYKDQPAMTMIIFNSISKDLKPDNTVLPPVLNKGVLSQAVEQIEKEKRFSENFGKVYTNNLRLYEMNGDKGVNTGENTTKWVKIPSKEHDPGKFEDNVTKLKNLSHPAWCTKATNARPYLSQGDFYIYLKNGQPKAAVRFIGDEIQEIQGAKNDGRIPFMYVDEIKTFLKEKDFYYNEEKI
jgi:hypothetical protein